MKKITRFFAIVAISLAYVSAFAQPSTSAPTPTVAAAKVISLFSNAYTNVTVSTWKTDWSPIVTLTDLQIAGNDVKKYTNLSFVGIETNPPTIDASSMNYFHLDYWTADITTFKVKLVDFGANGAYLGGDDVEYELSFTPTASTWNSIDIPLTNFTGLTTKAHLAQYILSCVPTGGTVYIDNMYFYNNTGTGLTNVTNIKGISCYPNPAVNKLTISAKSEISEVTVRNLIGQSIKTEVVNGTSKTIDLSGLASGNYFMVAKMSNGQVATQKIVKQ